jgi:pimeloyl-ACP methyl ester carboxylesterase
VTDTTTALPEGVTAERLEFPGGSVQLLRAGDGPPLLFLHAAGGAGLWHPFHGRLAERFAVIAPDHPGFGASDALPEVEGIDDLVYHYLEVMDRLRLDRPVVVGGSFGGWIAAELAVHSPERVGKLVLLSAAGLRIPDHMPADIFLMTPPELVEALFHDPAAAQGFLPEEPTVDDILQGYMDMSALARYAWAPYLNNPKLERRLHRITAPTLVVCPDDDRVIPRIHAERYAERIPNARLEIVETCGHAMYFERTDAFADAVLAFAAE